MFITDYEALAQSCRRPTDQLPPSRIVDQPRAHDGAHAVALSASVHDFSVGRTELFILKVGLVAIAVMASASSALSSVVEAPPIVERKDQ